MNDVFHRRFGIPGYVFWRMLFLSVAVLLMPVSSYAQTARTFFDALNRLGIRCNVAEIKRDDVRRFVLYEYGAVLVSENATLPTNGTCEITTKSFNDQKTEYIEDVDRFADGFGKPANRFSFGDFYLQPAAKASLQKVFNLYPGEGHIAVARNCNVDKVEDRPAKCTMLGQSSLNNDWALRSYQQTKANFGTDNATTRGAAVLDRIPWRDGTSYSAQRSNRPTMYIYAIPGTSQHHFGLAIDVTNDQNVIGPKRICDATCIDRLEANGWFRTVRYDPYHFTYLGYADPDKEKVKRSLNANGLRQVTCKDGVTYWVPNIDGYRGIGSWACTPI